MKKLIPLLLTALLFTTGCLNTTEEITVQKDGSGMYGMTLDFSGLFDMIQAMQGADPSAEKKAMQNMDTVIRFASFTDTSTKFTAAEKALLKNATIHMVMQEAQKKFVMEMRYPFKKMDDVEKIMELTQRSGSIMGKAMGAPEMEGGEQPPTPDFNSYYDLTFKQGVIEKKVNQEKLKAFQDNPQFEQLKSSSAMFSEATISSVIRLPQKAKKATGPGVKISDGGKLVTVAASLADALEDPNTLTFRIEY